MKAVSYTHLDVYKRQQISKAIFINDEDEAELKELQERGVSIFIQQLPAESAVALDHVLHR